MKKKKTTKTKLILSENSQERNVRSRFVVLRKRDVYDVNGMNSCSGVTWFKTKQTSFKLLNIWCGSFKPEVREWL